VLLNKSFGTFLLAVLVIAACIVPGLAAGMNAMVSAQPGVAPAGPSSPAEVEAFMDSMMPENLATYNVPGATVAVVYDGNVTLAKGYGFADLECGTPVDGNQTLFRIASISKLFAWTALMQLAEEGKINLDADVNTYLTGFKIPDTYPGSPVTVRDLMTHTPGFEDLDRHQIVNSVDDIIPLAAYCKENIPARIHPPGEVISYSNYGATLAAVIVEDVSGKPYEQYMQEEILTPLGMTRTSIAQPLPPALAPALAKSYASLGTMTVPVQDDIIVVAPVGAMTATARDMGTFMIAHLQNGRLGNVTIMKPETAQMMHATAYSPAPETRIDLGFYEMSLNGRRIISHGGDTTYFHADLLLFPEEKTGLFVSYNSPGGASARNDLAVRFTDHYFPDVKNAMKAPVNVTVPGEYAGTFLTTRRAYATIANRISPQTEFHFEVSPSGNSLVAWVVEGSKSEWVPAGKDLFVRAAPTRTPAERTMGDLAFTRDSSGAVNGFLFTDAPIITYERVPWYGTSAFTSGLFAACVLVFLSVLLWPAAFLIRKYYHIGPPAPHAALTHARCAAGVSALLSLGFIVAITDLAKRPDITSAYNMMPDAPVILVIVLVLPLLAAVLMGLAAFYTARAWKHGDGTCWERVHVAVLIAAFIAFLWWLNFWSLLGWRF